MEVEAEERHGGEGGRGGCGEVTRRGVGRVVRVAVIPSMDRATTEQGWLTVASRLVTGRDQSGRTVSDAELATLEIERDAFHGEWNYTSRPRPRAIGQLIV